ncbi:MAG: hypothetical protein KDC28_04340 [Saprospiraceae bacterium]|nr:hypothetical protein [Saprospiraceae bacterium]MCB9318478.1 hypothetical protein [Lewinellaceae bacterium]
MKNFWIILLALVLVCHLASLVLPWWSFAVIIGLAVFILQFPVRKAFPLGFLAVFVTWLLWSVWLYKTNATVLTPKVGELFGGLPPVALILVLSFLGGLIGGFAGWAGAALRKGLA